MERMPIHTAPFRACPELRLYQPLEGFTTSDQTKGFPMIALPDLLDALGDAAMPRDALVKMAIDVGLPLERIRIGDHAVTLIHILAAHVILSKTLGADFPPAWAELKAIIAQATLELVRALPVRQREAVVRHCINSL